MAVFTREIRKLIQNRVSSFLVLLLSFSVMLPSCRGTSESDGQIRVIIFQPPVTLHPRRSIDGIGQQLGALLFDSLTRIGPDLEITPGHASSWHHSRDGLTWTFDLRPNLKDHRGREISATDWVECLESYRIGKPSSPLSSAFPGWKSTERLENQIILKFKTPDPYLTANLSLLRFFRGARGANCPAASENGIVGSGDFRPEAPILSDLSPRKELNLIPLDSKNTSLRFLFVKDDNTRALLLASGGADVLVNSLSAGKTKWVREKLSDRFQFLAKEGVNVSYLAFNLRKKVLQDSKVRRAIAFAISRDEIVRHWMRGIGKVAYSLVSPILSESAEDALIHEKGAILRPDLAESARLLDSAGYHIRPDGFRLDLQYLTTTVREGIEMALLFRDQLAKVGIRLHLRIVEASVFYQALKGGDFDLYSSRWIGVHDASVLQTAYQSGNPRNRIGFSDPKIDQAILKALSEMDDQKRKKLFEKLQLELDARTAYFPLWYWNNVVVASNRLTGLDARETSSSGAFAPLARLKWRTP